MNELCYFIKRYLIYIIIFLMVIFNIVLIINKTSFYSDELIEKFTSLDGTNNNLGFDMMNQLKLVKPTDSFCESYMGSSNELNIACSSLTKNNCDITPCCVRSFHGNKCQAGNNSGPTFISKKTKFYHLGQCYDPTRGNSKC